MEDVSPSIEKYSGYGREELIGRPVGRFYHGAVDRRRLLGALLSSEEIRGFEITMQRKDGSVAHTSVNARALYAEDGAFAGVEGSLRDITPRKQVEDALRETEFRNLRLALAVDSASDGIVIVNAQAPEYPVIFSNPAFTRLAGYSADEILGKNLRTLFGPDTEPTAVDDICRGMRTAESATTALLIYRRDGSTFWSRFRVSPVRTPDGETRHYVAILTDVTDAKLQEMRSELERNLAIELGSVADPEEATRMVAETALRLGEVTAASVFVLSQEHGGIDIASHVGVSEEFVQRVVPLFEQGLRSGGRTSDIYYRLLHGNSLYGGLDGIGLRVPGVPESESLAVGFIVPILHEGRLVATLNVGSDRSEGLSAGTRGALEHMAEQIGSVLVRLQAQEAIRESRQNLQRLYESASDFVYVLDEHGNILHTNPAVGERLRYLPKEIAKMRLDQFHPVGMAGSLAACLKEVMREGRGEHSIPLVARDGTAIPAETRLTSGTWNGMTAIFAFGRDVTERRRAEAALRESEVRYQSVVSALHEGIIVQNSQGRIIATNESAARILGLTQDELLGRTSADPRWNAVYEDGTPLAGEEYPSSVALRSGTPLAGIVLGVYVPDGTLRWISINSEPLVSEPGSRPFAVVVSFTDITDQRNAEQELRRRVGLQSLVTGISARFIETGPERVDEVIEESLDRLGRFEGVDRAYVFQIDEQSRMLSNTHEWAADGVEPQKDHRQNIPVGAFDWWMEHLESGRPIHVADVSRMPDEAAPEREQLAAQDIKSVVVVPMLRGCRPVGFVGFDSVRTTKQWTNDSIDLLTLVASVFFNALERQRSGRQLRASEEKYRGVVNRISEVLFQTDPEGRWTFLNPSWERITGFTVEDSLGARAMEYVHDQDRRQKAGELRSLFSDGAKSMRCEVRVITRTGELRWVEAFAHPLNEDDVGSGMAGTLTDITERRRIQDHLLRLRAALAQSIDGVSVIGVDDRLEFVNGAWAPHARL